MTQPACSIIIPTRDCVNYLPTTLATIDLQGRRDLEVIVVDDGSTDATMAWLASRSASSFSLRVIETGGIGPGRARNAGVAVASANLIAFLDADDQWLPGKLDRQLAFHEAHPQLGLSFTDYIHVTPDGHDLGSCFDYWKCNWTKGVTGAYFMLRNAEANILGANVVGTSTVVVNRDLFLATGGFGPQMASAEDWHLWLQLAAAAPVACSTSVTMSYLVRPGSMTANRRSRIISMRTIMADYAERTEPEFKHALRLAKARCNMAEAELARAQGKPATAAIAHLKAMAANPGWRTGRAAAADIAAAVTKPFRTLAPAR
jgi:glycosyltransferase involved in cell wall biosynthesis